MYYERASIKYKTIRDRTSEFLIRHEGFKAANEILADPAFNSEYLQKAQEIVFEKGKKEIEGHVARSLGKVALLLEGIKTEFGFEVLNTTKNNSKLLELTLSHTLAKGFFAGRVKIPGKTSISRMQFVLDTMESFFRLAKQSYAAQCFKDINGKDKVTVYLSSSREFDVESKKWGMLGVRLASGAYLVMPDHNIYFQKYKGLVI